MKQRKRNVNVGQQKKRNNMKVLTNIIVERPLTDESGYRLRKYQLVVKFLGSNYIVDGKEFPATTVEWELVNE